MNIASFATRPIGVTGTQYDWTESTETQYLVKERLRIAGDVASNRIGLRVTLTTGEQFAGQEAVNQIPYLAICYKLSKNPAKLVVRAVMLDPKVGPKASCIAAINKWRAIEQRDTENGEMVEAYYFYHDTSVDWINYELPQAVPAA